MNYSFINEIILFQANIIKELDKIKKIKNKREGARNYLKAQIIKDVNKKLDELISYIEKEDLKNLNRFRKLKTKEKRYIENKQKLYSIWNEEIKKIVNEREKKI